GATAAEWLKEVDESTLREVIRDYGEERHAFQIAKAIVTRRDDASRGPLSTTRELAQVVASAVKTSWRDKGQDPATRTFQAI
ncbi:16S rRNA (cytosine(1402)-N(4))-methyltransferase, partial [Acinetobacter baumannii]